MFNNHTHIFLPSEADKSIIFCRCGEMKHLHQHKWKHYSEINRRGLVVGEILECELCGELKNHYL